MSVVRLYGRWDRRLGVTARAHPKEHRYSIRTHADGEVGDVIRVKKGWRFKTPSTTSALIYPTRIAAVTALLERLRIL